jgi:hypothetical protein
MRRSRRASCSEDIVVEILGCHAVAKEPVGSDAQKELRIEVETPFHKLEIVEHHGLDDLTVDEVILPRLGIKRSITAAMPRVSKAPATTPR